MTQQDAPLKPRFGEPCNGCGVCCKIVPCPIARDLIGAREGPCPALEHDAGRFWCGLIRNPHKHIYTLREKPWADPAIRQMLLETGGWQGLCDSIIEGEDVGDSENTAQASAL